MKKIIFTVALLCSTQHLLGDEETVQQNNNDQEIAATDLTDIGTAPIFNDNEDFLDDVADEVEDVKHEEQKVEYTPAMIAAYALATVQHFVIEPLYNVYQTVKEMVHSLLLGKHRDHNSAS